MIARIPVFALAFFIIAFPALAKPPNVLVFLTDDQGWGDLSSSGNLDLSTPHIDSLKSDGASFDRFYVCPVCSPTRAEFLTGRYHPRSRVSGVSRGLERINLDEVTIADLFRKAGYTTGAFGKWHNGMQFPYHPNGRGFDEFYGFCSGHWGNYFSPILDHNGKIVKGEGFCIDDFTNKTMDFMAAAVGENKPFFAYVPYNTPHSPMQVPERFWEKFKNKELKFNNLLKKENPKVDQHKRCALAMCENLDWNVGRILEKLTVLNVADDTIVVWFHDNGPNGTRWNGAMRGKKGSTDEGGCRSPLYLRWGGKIKPQTFVPQISSVRDLLPTLCDLAGVKMEGTKPLDGMSLEPLLFNPQSEWPDRYIINHWRSKISVRTQGFRLDAQGNLYDMVADPSQKTPVNDKHKEVSRRLDQAAKDYRENLISKNSADERPFIMTHPGSRFTQLPARDGKGHGNISHSSRHPNSSYMRAWKTTEDKITFFGEVAKEGVYEVALFYAAKKAGGKYQISFKGEALDFTVEAHDTPEIGSEQDRYRRTESYEKDFKRKALGNIHLKKGTGEFAITAKELKGDEDLEVRLVTLERVE